MGFKECLDLAREESFVEFRFDLLNLSPDQVTGVVTAANRSIATCRPGSLDTETRIRTMILALKAGTSYVDIEHDADIPYREEITRETRICVSDLIISYHDFNKTPDYESLKRIISSCRNNGADVVKIACKVNGIEDVHTLMGLYREGGRMVVIGMGEKGLITRIAAPFMGAEFTFASPGKGFETAPGQIDRIRLESIIAGIESSFDGRKNKSGHEKN
jgi:3-dehydroquinate dehydratase-1